LAIEIVVDMIKGGRRSIMRVFMCGIIQGSHTGRGIHAQTYRKRLAEMITRHYPHVEVYCPVDLHPESPSYDDSRAFEVFEESLEAVRKSDLLIAYVPEASMGSAIEMWEAHRAGIKVLTISTLAHNWVIKYVSDRIIPSLEEMERLLASGALAPYLQIRKIR
jgi:hypothetical protein